MGILYETRKQKFNQIHAQFPYLLSNLCNELGIRNLIHISALGIKEKHTSKYMQSKLQGEKNIQETFKPAVILRPSVCFGPGDKFFTTFASIAQFSPILPLIGGGKTKFAPIYVGDVAKAIVKALELNNSESKIYELGGPENYSFKELMEILLKEIRKKRFLIPIPWGFAKFQSFFLQMLPNPLLNTRFSRATKISKYYFRRLSNIKRSRYYRNSYPKCSAQICPKIPYRWGSSTDNYKIIKLI